ncbi:DUF1622 domain-containing protein [Candidatus Gracilibacteria bacterium]|nr:DUF1622 domain-containing protein [Candidatus Gracilibacteria bacterium]
MITESEACGQSELEKKLHFRYNAEMKEFILAAVGNISFFIGLFGIIIISIGIVLGVVNYLFLVEKKYKNHQMEIARFVLSKHLILGLDFFVAQDIINTFLLNGQQELIDLAQLIVVVGLRVILNHFLGQEIKELKILQYEEKGISKNTFQR